MIDAGGQPVYLNSACVALWVLPDNLVDVVDERLVAHIISRLNNPRSFLARVNAAPETYDVTGERIFLKDGRVFHSVAWPLVDGDGAITGQVWSFRDITERLAATARASQALTESESRFRSLVENASDLITVVEPDSTIVYQSPSSERVLGYEAEELIGSQLIELVHPDDRPIVFMLLGQVSNGDSQATQVDVRLKDAQGAWHYVEISATDRQADPAVRGFVLNARDVTARHMLENELSLQANHDPLTGLLNRRGFMLELEKALKGSASERLPRGALLLFDLDDFKDVNDSLGHHAGDRVLLDLANVLTFTLGESAIIARLGGDEFSVLLQGATLVEAAEIGPGLLMAIRGHNFETGGAETIDVTASLGMVAFPRDGATVEELMSRADLALYEAKAQGRNRARVYAHIDNLEAKAEARLKLRHQIRRALKEKRLVLYGQPIIDLNRQAVSHYELLLRMKQDRGPVIAAKDFIDLAESSGLIVPIDVWVFREAMKLINAQVTRGVNQTIAINLSARAFADEDSQAWLESELETECRDASRLVIEVTETAAISDIVNAERFMKRLKGMGCRFALDDFGVGFSSLQRLRRLPVDYLKIDGSFIRAITQSVEDQALVQSIVAVARALQMETIAEFVETREQLELVHDLGVDFAQGNYIGKPRSLIGLWPGTSKARAA